MKARRFLAAALAAAIVLSGMDGAMRNVHAEHNEVIAGDIGTPNNATSAVSTPSDAEKPTVDGIKDLTPDDGRDGFVSITDGSGLVTVEAEESALPEDAELLVEALDLLGDEGYRETILSLWETAKEDLENFLRIYAYDIRFYDADGDEITPAGVVSVTFHDVDLTASENAGVYHILDGGGVDKVTSVHAAETRSTSTATKTDITFPADEPGLYALAMDSGISGMASNDNVYNVLVGEYVTIASTRGAPHYGWFSSDADIATVRGNGNASLGMARSAAITGVKPGTVKITHYYGMFGVYSDTYTVIVSYKPDLVLDAEISGSEVAYVRTGKGSYGASANRFMHISNGKNTVQNFMSEADHDVQIMILAKPEKNHILVDLGEGKDKYSTSESYPQETSFKGWANWDKVVKEAAADGYVAYFGYTRDGYASNNNNTIALRVRSLDPPVMDVTATPDKTEGVSLGDSLSFTVNIEPHTTLTDNYKGNGRTIDLKVENKELLSVTINGKKYTNIRKNGDGTFTVADYRATADDCREGEIRMMVEASITYSYDLDVKDRDGVTGKARQTAVVEKSAAAAARIAKSNFAVKLAYENVTHPNTAPVTGDKIRYTARVQNYGDVLRNLEFSDSMVANAGKPFSMSGGAATSFIYTYLVTDADVLAGKVVNTAMVRDKETGSAASDTLTIATGSAKRGLLTKVSLGKGADQNRRFRVGDTVPLTVSVANTGNVTQKSVAIKGTNMVFTAGSGYSVTDGGKTATVSNLAPGKSLELASRHTVTQDDMDSHSQIVSSVGVEGDAGTVHDPQSVTYTFFHLDRRPGLTAGITITNPKAAFVEGDEIHYEIVVSNTGNTNLDLKIRDTISAWNMAGQEAVDLGKADQTGEGTGFAWDGASGTASLRLGLNASHRFAYSHNVTAGDAAKRSMTNTVTVTEANNRVAEARDTAAAHFADRPELKVTVTEKNADSPGYDLGEMIPCTIMVENTGSVELADVYVSYFAKPAKSGTSVPPTADTDASGSSATDTGTSVPPVADTGVSGSSATDTAASWKIARLMPGASNAREFVVSHLVTEADIAAGGVTISAEAEAEYLLGLSNETVKSEDSVTVKTAEGKVTITASKVALVGASGEAGPTYGVVVGDAVPIINTARNVGNMTESIVIDDTFSMEKAAINSTPGVTGISRKDGKISAVLKPGSSLTISYEHTVTQQDIDSAQDKAETRRDSGDKVILSTMTVKDRTEEKELARATAYIEVDERERTLTARKTLTNGTETGFKAGDAAEFDIIVENHSQGVVRNIRVTEKLEGAEIVGDSGIDSLPAGDSATVKARYTVTQDDIDRFAKEGEILKNMAAIEAEGVEREIYAHAMIPLSAGNPGLSLDGHIVFPDGETGHRFTAGETAQFEIAVENTGGLTLKDIDVNELLDGAVFLSDGAMSAGKAAVMDGQAIMNDGRTVRIASLNPGETLMLKATYLIKQEDMDSGSDLVNPIRAFYADGAVSGTEIPIPLAEKETGVSVKKFVTNEGGGTGEGGRFRAGDEVLFDVTVENTGNITLRYLIVSELLDGANIKADGGSMPTKPDESQAEADDGAGYGLPSYTLEGKGKAVIAKLSPGRTVTLKAGYRLTQGDVDSKSKVINAVTVRNGRTEDPHVEERAEAEVTGIERGASLVALVRLKNRGSGKDGAFKGGDTALFDIVLWNSGVTTLRQVTVTEMLEGARLLSGSGYSVDGFSAQVLEIAPGMTVTLGASYTVTKKDIMDRGELRNTLVVYGGNERDASQTISAVIPKDTQVRPSPPDPSGEGDDSGGSGGDGPGGDSSGSGNGPGSDSSGSGNGPGNPGGSAAPGMTVNPDEVTANKATEGTGANVTPGENGNPKGSNGAALSSGTDTGKTRPEGHGSSDANRKDPDGQIPATGDPGATGYMIMLLVSFIICCACAIGIKRNDWQKHDSQTGK